VPSRKEPPTPDTSKSTQRERAADGSVPQDGITKKSLPHDGTVRDLIARDGVTGDGIATRDGVPTRDGAIARDGVGTRKAAISTVSHTLDTGVAERLRHFAFRERISESAVIEFALRALFESDDETALGRRLREAGAALRRRNRGPDSRSE
jgi:hypothetical protein